MHLHSKLWVAAAFLIVILLSGCGLSLAGDVTPPPNYVAPTEPPVGTPTNEQVASQQVDFPLVPPDPAGGAAIYAEKCMPCHGEKGMGDGPQASKLPNQAAPIGSPELARKAKPADWFQVVTSGNLQKFMPGFSESLSDRQRWDVVAYALSLSTSTEDLSQGKQVYDQNCAACHGPNGDGDGAQAASLSTKPVAWKQDQSRLARLSEDDIVQVISGGNSGHPALNASLDSNQQYQVAAYVRSLGYATNSQPAEAASSGNPPGESTSVPGTPQATGEAVSQTDQKIVISGQVTEGTPGGKLPDGLKVKLLGFQGMTSAVDLSADVGSDGSYRFENVPFKSDYVYIAQVDANGLTFNSTILHGTDVKDSQASLPLQVYETAKDPSVLKVDRMHVFFDFSKPGIVQVVNLYVISNPTDRVVIAENKDKPIVEYTVPKGATNLQFQDGQIGDGRYVQTDNGFGDTQAIVPGAGQYQLLYAYDMTYDNGLDIAITAPLPVDAAIVMVPPVGVKLNSSQLTNAGQRDVQGMSFQMYQSNGGLKPGDTLSISLSGKAKTDTSSAAGDNSRTPLFVGIGVFGLALIGAGAWLYFQRKTMEPAVADAPEPEELPVNEEPGESSETILDAILALDDLHGNGKLPEAAYQERRAELKAMLARAMEKEKGG